MMLTRDTATKLESLDLMLESCIRDQSSHERRNQHLAALRRLLDYWISDLRRYQDSEDREAKALTTLEAIYQLSIWQLEHETHVDVKTRLFMARNLIARFLFKREHARSAAIDKRTREIISRRVETPEIPQYPDDAFFDAYSEKDITEDLGIEPSSVEEAPSDWEQQQ